MTKFFVAAPNGKVSVVPEGFEDALKGPGYVVTGRDEKFAKMAVTDFRRGAQWTLDVVQVVRGD